MEFVDLKAQYAVLRDAIDSRIGQVLEHGKFIGGPEVRELEAALESMTNRKHVVGCGNGTDALQLALMATGIGPGDAVATTPFTFIATAEVITLLGATPVFVDIDPKTLNIDPAALSAALHSMHTSSDLRVKAVIAVDLFGRMADYENIEPLCEEYGVELIEDAAQSLGATTGSCCAGSRGRIATTSFFPAKPLGCYGDGGAIFTDDDRLAEVLRSLGAHGRGSHKYDNVRVGVNSRLDTVQAAVLLAKLGSFEAELDGRRERAEAYAAMLGRLPVVLPDIPDDRQTTWANYWIMADTGEQRARCLSALERDGIPTAINYPTPLHLQGAFAHLGHKQGDFPHAESASERIFSVPLHPFLTLEDQARVVGVLETQLG